MRQLFTGFLLLLTLVLSATPISDNLIKALKMGDSEKIAHHFGTSVNLSTPNNEGVYSKTQAQLILKKFFLKHPPSSFSIVHQGDSKNNSSYMIGNLSAAKGSFRTYILYKEADKKLTILELKIEMDE